MHCWRVTGFWRGPRASSQRRGALPYSVSDVRAKRSGENTAGPSASLRPRTKRIIRESAQGPLERGPADALCAEHDVFVSAGKAGFYIISVADALIQNNLCSLSAREPCSRTLEQEKYSAAEASAGFSAQDNLLGPAGRAGSRLEHGLRGGGRGSEHMQLRGERNVYKPTTF